MGHIARNCPLKAEQFKKGNKNFHAHAIEDEGTDKEKNNEDEDSTKEYVLISSHIVTMKMRIPLKNMVARRQQRFQKYDKL